MCLIIMYKIKLLYLFDDAKTIHNMLKFKCDYFLFGLIFTYKNNETKIL